VSRLDAASLRRLISVVWSAESVRGCCAFAAVPAASPWRLWAHSDSVTIRIGCALRARLKFEQW